MQLDVFWNNKIPSTESNWTDELILVASILNEFDGLVFDRSEIVDRFASISNRLPDSRDSSDYRDQYGAYVSYLGLMQYEKSGNHWICRMNPKAKELLCGVLPDPQAYVRFQMSLFQYPNPIGASFSENGQLRIEAGALKKRHEQVVSSVQTVPFRMMLRVLLNLNQNYGFAEAYISYQELWYCLFTNSNAIGTFNPDGALLADEVINYRRKRQNPMSLPIAPFRNLHILQHTGIVEIVGRNNNDKKILLRPEAGRLDTLLGQATKEIADMDSFFSVETPGTLESIKGWTKRKLESGEWSNFYSGKSISYVTIQKITEPITEVEANLLTTPNGSIGLPLHDFNTERKIRARRLASRSANREETEALREKANLEHRTILEIIADKLKANGIEPESNTYIDLCCREPKKLLFEVKSCHEDNFLPQVRKGVSQLYEYRYRHNELNGAKVILALGSRPKGDLEWLLDYLINDREIAVCWLEGENNLVCPSACHPDLQLIVNYFE